MRFCDKCGSRMRATADGFSCPKCGAVINSESIGAKKVETPNSDPVYVIKHEKNEHARVNKSWTRCGNNQAFHWFSVISGEHAGVNRERTVEHFKCTKCLHSWGNSF